jgi:hypothetical protein
MYKSIIVLGISLLLLWFVGCSSISVTQDYDTSINCSDYKPYEWGTAKNPNDVPQKNQLVLERVYKAIDNTLGSKGFTKVTSNPDFVVHPHAGTQEKTDVQNWGYGYGGWWGAGPYGGRNIDVTQYTEGTLYIDMVDMKKNQLIWRGVGTGILGDPSTPDESTKNVNNAVAQVLKNFPPQPKSNNK